MNLEKWFYRKGGRALVGPVALLCAALVLVSGPAFGQDASEEIYTVGERDVISISVWGQEELSVSVPVRPDGRISMPLVGEIMAAGVVSSIPLIIMVFVFQRQIFSGLTAGAVKG